MKSLPRLRRREGLATGRGTQGVRAEFFWGGCLCWRAPPGQKEGCEGTRRVCKPSQRVSRLGCVLRASFFRLNFDPQQVLGKALARRRRVPPFPACHSSCSSFRGQLSLLLLQLSASCGFPRAPRGGFASPGGSLWAPFGPQEPEAAEESSNFAGSFQPAPCTAFNLTPAL